MPTVFKEHPDSLLQRDPHTCRHPLQPRKPRRQMFRADQTSQKDSLLQDQFGHGVTSEWHSNKPTSPEDIIIVTVQTNQLGRIESFDDPLPERYAFISHNFQLPHVLTQDMCRPQPRNFLHRLSSRVLPSNRQWQNIRAVRMPRREFLRHHKRDEEGNYAGTEPRQDWDDAMPDLATVDISARRWFQMACIGMLR
jgi:hypothetical protein